MLLFGIGTSTNTYVPFPYKGTQLADERFPSGSTSCAAGVIACITFYFISKILISLFLLERVSVPAFLSAPMADPSVQVHIVNSQDGTPRMQSKAYKLCLGVICLYIGYLILAAFGKRKCSVVQFRGADVASMIGRVAELDGKRSCHIGLKLWV